MKTGDKSDEPPTRTTCPYCGVGCGVLAAPDGEGGAAIAGDPEHPANYGRLCSKGAALGETLALEGRLLRPRISGREAEWDAALDLVAERLRAAIPEHGPESVAIYGSGQLLTEDYYVANKLMKGFIGSANIDTNSRLCMASSVAGHRRAFGTDTVPGTYEDLERADLIVLVGSNLAWCHPVLHQRIAAAKAARPGMRVVNVDPRRTATCDLADMHLRIRPDGDAALFVGLLREIGRARAVDAAFVRDHVADLETALAAAEGWTTARVAAEADLPEAEIRAFFRAWIDTERVVTLWSQGVNQSASGTDKVSAIINCHLATGRIGRAGMGPFSVTGQPNAMGGREVGGLANMLAAHLDLEDEGDRALVARFWGVPRIAERPGLKAVELFRACAEGRIRALWVLATNPAQSMPEADAVAAALEACPFVVVSDMVADTDTARRADVLLPACGWGEKDGTVTNSERRISRQRAFLPAPGEARPDWWALKEVAGRLGWGAAFAYERPADIFREHAALSAVAAAAGRDFDIGALAGLDEAGYEALSPVRWPVGGAERFFGDGRFFTADGRARAVAVVPPALPAAEALRLNTGRVRDHWHTMTRTGRSPQLSQHVVEPFAEMHPADAEARGIAAGDLVAVEGADGRAILRAVLTVDVRRGEIFAPMHWGGAWGPAGRIGVAVAAATDPVSGQPALKGARVAVRRWSGAWHGYAVSRTRPEPAAEYWAVASTTTGWRLEIADVRLPEDWEAYARELFKRPGAEAVSLLDRARGRARVALVEDDAVVAALYAAPEPVAVAREHLAAALCTAPAAALLAGRPGREAPDPGPVVCACLGIGSGAIAQAVAAGAVSVEDIGQRLGAGTQCGSCRPEIRALLAAAPTAGGGRMSALGHYVRILGRGPGRRRALTEAEAEDAMRLMLRGEAAPEAVDALLMLMRFRGEGPEEVAGFVRAMRAEVAPWAGLPVALDWPTYASGRSRGLPWFLLAARLVAASGRPVLIHGWHAAGFDDALARVGIPRVVGPVEAAAELARGGIAYVSLADLAPAALALLRLREVLGLRSAVNTALRLLNPARARTAVQGVFHPPYRALGRDAAARLGQERIVVLKGGGGEFERHPGKAVVLSGLAEGRAFEATAPALLAATRRLADPDARPEDLDRLWSGAWTDPFAEAVVMGTAALALLAAGAPDLAAAEAEARRLWHGRGRALAA